MRVAILTHSATHGAFTTVARNIATGLRRADVDVDVLYLQGAVPEALQHTFADGVTLVRVGGRSRTCWWAVARHLCAARPDALISLGWVLNPSAVVATLVARTGTTLVLNEGSLLSYETRVEHRGQAHLRLLGRLAKIIYPLAAAVTGASEPVVRDLVEEIGLRPGRPPLHVVPNSVDGDHVRGLAGLPDPGLVGPPDDAPLFVNVARHAQLKNLPLLLRAFHRYRADGGAGVLVLVGGGPMTASLRDLAAQLGLPNASIVFRGPLVNPFPQLAAATAFVLSSDAEGFGLALVEAMALGVPTIATDCPGGPRSILRDGEAGVLVPTGDEAALADALGQIGTDVDLRRRLSRRGAARAEDFSPARIGARWLSILAPDQRACPQGATS
jgi:glycosyltransferase involved in cell wall biosynthesis